MTSLIMRIRNDSIIDIINCDYNSYNESFRGCKSRSGSNAPITSIKTRVSNNNPYSTIIATLVPL